MIFMVLVNGLNLTISIPITEQMSIRSTIRKRLVIHDCLGAATAPMVNAAISGKIISFSPDNSDVPTMSVKYQADQKAHREIIVFFCQCFFSF